MPNIGAVKDADVTALEQQDVAHSSQISALENTDVGHSADIANVTTFMTDLSTNLPALQTALSALLAQQQQ